MPNILNAPLKSQKSVSEKIIKILKDNKQYVAQIESVATVLEGIIGNAKIKNREKIRDYIRAESVVDEFTSRLFPNVKKVKKV